MSSGSIRKAPSRSGSLAVSVQGETVVIEFPEATPSLNRLHGSHWSKVQKARVKWRKYAWAARVKLQGRPDADHIALPFNPGALRIVRYGPRMLDEENLSAGAKELVDALVQEGFFVDDSPAYLVRSYIQRLSCERKTVVTLSSAAS